MSWNLRTRSNTGRKKIVVGITSRSHKDNFQWLKEFINKYLDLLEVRHLPITNSNRRDWEEAVRTCSAIVLYHTKHQGRVNVTDVGGSLYDAELSYLNHCLGREKVLVVLDDMDDISEKERQRILKAQRSLERLSSHLILIPERNKVEAANRKLEEFCSSLSEGVRTSPMEEERPERKSYSSKTSEPPRSIKNAKNSSTKDRGKCSATNSTSSSSSAPSKPRPPPHPTYQVGIFSRSAESNYKWLVDSLKADGCLRSPDIKKFDISNQYSTFRSELQQCHFAILYHTRKQKCITNVTDSLYDNELREMSETLGKQNVIVVVDDLESSGSEEKDRILDSQSSIRKCARDLFLFTEKEKHTRNLEEIREIIQKSVRTSPMEEESSLIREPHTSATSKLESFSRSIKNPFKDIGKYFTTNSTSSSLSAPSKPRPPPHPTYRVGIFSRSAESNYTWLVESLKADGRLRSADIKAFYISNHYSTFRSGLQQCHFAILYHTKKQGRINITDVTDSLYDNELREMSETLGKQSVIVVVDDLESSGSEEKDRILDSQLSIRKCARDLFLFTETEKHTRNLEEIRGIIQKSLPNVTAQRSVPDTAHPTAAHSDGESSRRDLISLDDSPENQMLQNQEATSDMSPSSSESVSHQTAFHKSDNREPESKRPKRLSSNENTNSMDIEGDLSKPSFFDFLHAIHMKWDKSQQENEKLRRMIAENLSQEEMSRDQKNIIMALTTERDTMKSSIEEERRTQNIAEGQKHLEEEGAMNLEIESGDGQEEMREEEKTSHEGEDKVHEEEIGMKTSFPGREEGPHKPRPQPQEQEKLPEKGHHMKEYLQNTAGSLSLENLTMEELITGLQGIIIEQHLKIQRQREEILNYDYICKELKCELERKVQKIQ